VITFAGSVPWLTLCKQGFGEAEQDFTVYTPRLIRHPCYNRTCRTEIEPSKMWKNKWTRGTKRKSVKENQKTAILQDKSWRDTSAFDRRQSCAFPTRDTDIRRQSWQSTGVPYISEMNDSENTPNRCRIRGLTHEQSSPFSWLTRPRYSSGRNSPA
jgi:hypothetical protein